MPAPFVTVYAFFKWRAMVSMRAEVELSDQLTLGRGTKISSFVKLKSTSGPVKVGRNAGFGAGCFIGTGERGLEIGDNFICGPNTVIVASNYDYSDINAPLESMPQTSRGVRIGNNVWIGSNLRYWTAPSSRTTHVVANGLVNRTELDHSGQSGSCNWNAALMHAFPIHLGGIS